MCKLKEYNDSKFTYAIIVFFVSFKQVSQIMHKFHTIFDFDKYFLNFCVKK